MNTQISLEKSIVIRSRDFFAESQEKDGTNFRIDPGWRNDAAERWWRDHRLDNERQVFLGEEADETSLVCADEVEAQVLLTQLQIEFNGVAT